MERTGIHQNNVNILNTKRWCNPSIRLNSVAPELSPIQYQITTPSNQLTSNTIRAIKTKYKQAKERFKKQFFESLAPTQGQELSNLISTPSPSSHEEEIPENLRELRDAYCSCQNEKSKMLVLSVIPMQKYTKANLSEVFGCTRKALYKAEKWKDSYGASQKDIQKPN
ncbi:hypothetical protein JTE90_025453 [Oedothorax gibbosus]|uniref:Uncharacterized protein n=1 Tax=Oedothorax gibbosus TaxID=931172 RepID=A0AAV6U948_9ARAC|nr:hypothetical protein JTE90_025453 [Oedothorax gibbosus]